MYLPLDLETTGLDPNEDHILEVGWSWLDDDLRQTKSVESRLVTPSVSTHDILRAADPVALDMHTKSGLLKDLDQGDTLMLEDIEDMILDDIQNHLDKRSDIILFGMGPQFDRKFIDRWMPRLGKKLHYRHYDVRTLVNFFSTLGVDHGILNLQKHRAGSDTSESILIAQAYRGWVLDNTDPRSY